MSDEIPFISDKNTGSRFYPPFESAAQDDAKLLAKADKWALAFKAEDPKAMDAQLRKLTVPEINRVIVMGQRILAGKPPIAATKKDKKNETKE